MLRTQRNCRGVVAATGYSTESHLMLLGLFRNTKNMLVSFPANCATTATVTAAAPAATATSTATTATAATAAGAFRAIRRCLGGEGGGGEAKRSKT